MRKNSIAHFFKLASASNRAETPESFYKAESALRDSITHIISNRNGSLMKRIARINKNLVSVTGYCLTLPPVMKKGWPRETILINSQHQLQQEKEAELKNRPPEFIRSKFTGKLVRNWQGTFPDENSSTI